MKDNIEYAYSFDEERFYGDIQSAIDDAENTGDFKTGDTITIYKGRSCRAQHSEFIWVDNFIEDMQLRAYDNYGEFGEDYLIGLEKQKVKELESLIVNWFKKNVPEPTFYSVANVEETQHVIED